jgi:hypothetical protein
MRALVWEAGLSRQQWKVPLRRRLSGTKRLINHYGRPRRSAARPGLQARPMGRIVLTVLGMVAEMELGFIRDRQRAGIDAAKARGVYKSRPVTVDRARIISEWGRQRSPRPSGASEETSTKRSRPQS